MNLMYLDGFCVFGPSRPNRWMIFVASTVCSQSWNKFGFVLKNLSYYQTTSKLFRYAIAVKLNDLNFKQHIKMLEGKVARSVGILTKLKYIFPQKVMLQLYHALVYPFLSYGLIIWGSTYPTYIKRLKSLQNQAVRAVARCHYRDDVKPYYFKFNILQLDDLFKHEIAKFVYCYLTNKTPNSFRNYFCKTLEHSSRVTRQSSDNSNLHIPRYRTNRLQRCIKYQGVKVWNSIPQKIRVLSYKKFNVEYKNVLLNGSSH